LDNDDLAISSNRMPDAGDLNLVRLSNLIITVRPKYDASAGDFDEAATTDNQIFEVQTDMGCQLGQYSGTSDEVEDFATHGNGYFPINVSDIPLSHFSVDCSAWTTENILLKVLALALEYLDTSGIQGADPEAEPNAVTGTYEEDTPAP
jgi:hypothetical protein